MNYARTKIGADSLALYTHYSKSPWPDESGWISGKPDFSGAAYWDGAAWGQVPEQPSPNHVWQSGAWVDPRTTAEVLTQAKAQRWEVIKAAREAAEFGGFSWNGSTFDSDAISQSRIQGALQLAAMAGPDFATDWTLQDNTVRHLTAADLAQVGAALGAHVAASHAHARELRAAIESATTPESVNAITW